MLRLWAATEARRLGRGGVSTVAKAIGMSRTTIHAGLTELKAMAMTPASKSATHDRVRAVGGGRKKLSDKDATNYATWMHWSNQPREVTR